MSKKSQNKKTRSVKCNCGKHAYTEHITAYWWQVFCSYCKRFTWGYGTEEEAVVSWLRLSHDEKKGKEWPSQDITKDYRFWERVQ